MEVLKSESFPVRTSEDVVLVRTSVRRAAAYSPRLMHRLGLAVESGAVRVSLAHYNTVEEVWQLGTVLARLRGYTAGA